MVYTFTYRNPGGDVVIVDLMSLNGRTEFKGAPLHVSAAAIGSQCADTMQPVRDIFVSAPTRSANTSAGFLGALLITLILGIALYEVCIPPPAYRPSFLISSDAAKLPEGPLACLSFERLVLNR